MSILWVRRVSGDFGTGERGSYFFRERLLAKSDNAEEVRGTVITAAIEKFGTLPSTGQNLVYVDGGTTTAAILQRLEPKKHARNPFLWEIEMYFDRRQWSRRSPADEQQAPNLRRPRWRGRFIPVPLARFTDLSTPKCYLLSDSAATPFDPPPDIPIYCDEITVTRWEASVNRGTQRGYMGKSNSGTFLGALAGEALMDSIDADEEFIDNAYWFQVTYRILCKPVVILTLPLGGTTHAGGFDPEYILDAGPMELQTQGDGTIKKVPILHGAFYDGRPAMLDGSGHAIPIDPSSGALTDDPHFLLITTKPRVDWSGLGLSPPPGWTGS
jgi:hypothetical protein